MRRAWRPCSTPASAFGTRSRPRPARAASTPTSASIRRATSPRWPKRFPNCGRSHSTAAPRPRIGRKQLQGVAGLALVDLPSSSPAYASLPFERKREAWLALRAYL